MLHLRDCSVSYGERPAFRGVTLSATPGISCLVGPSGCGKTTLLLAAAGLVRPCSGSVSLDDEPVRAGDRRVGLILQQYGLFPWFSVRENVELGLRLRRVAPEERRRTACRELRMLGLAEQEDRYPRELSGGQQQRVAIARAYALRPTLLLMDEPFSALDAPTREGLQDLLLEAARSRPTSVLMVTHSIEEAACLGNPVWVMAGVPGGITGRVDNPGTGTPGYRQRPEYLGVCNRIRALMSGAGGPP